MSIFPDRSCMDAAAWESYHDSRCPACGSDDYSNVLYCTEYAGECYATCPDAAALYRAATPLWKRALNWLLLRGTSRYYLRCEFVRERERCNVCQRFL